MSPHGDRSPGASLEVDKTVFVSKFTFIYPYKILRPWLIGRTPAGTESMGPIVHWLQTCRGLMVSKLIKMTRKAVTLGLCPYTPPPFKIKSNTEKNKNGDGVVFPTFQLSNFQNLNQNFQAANQNRDKIAEMQRG
jgi:hypothetical protein